MFNKKVPDVDKKFFTGNTSNSIVHTQMDVKLILQNPIMVKLKYYNLQIL